MRVMLIFPPGWMPYAPYLALPRLTAYLRRQGHEVIQRDLNLEAYVTMLDPAFLQEALDDVQEKLESMPPGQKPPGQVVHPLRLVAAGGDHLVSEVEGLVDFYRSEAFFADPLRTARNTRLLNACLRLAVAPYYPAHLSLNELRLPYDASAGEIRRAIDNESVNFTRPLLRDHFLDSILEAQPDVVGISISCFQQVIPSLTLASLLKERRPDLHVVLGGNTATRIADALVRHADDYFELFDSLIVGEGELALQGLTEALAGRRSLDEVPGLVYRDAEGKIHHNPVELPDLNELPTPDFDGLPLDQYLSPELMLPLSTSRGCHWGKCAFCERDIAGETGYQFRKDELVIEDLRTLRDKYDTRYVEFNEDDVPVARLRRLAERMIEAHLDLEWFALGRLERAMTSETCQTLRQAGCRALLLGLESGSQRMLDLMDKGLTLEQAEKALHTSSQADIWNECYILIGFPGEGFGEFMQTVRFVGEHADDIHSVSVSAFYLTKYSAIARRPADFHIQTVEQPELEFLWSSAYLPESGLTSREATDMVNRFWWEMKRIYPNQEFRAALAWEPFYLFVSKRGADVVKDISLKQSFDETGWKERVLRLQPSTVIHSLDHKAVLYDMATGKRFSLKPAARQFLELCQTGMPVGQAIDEVAQAEGLALESAERMSFQVLKVIQQDGGIEWA